MTKQITTRQQQILDYIRDCTIPPTYAEIAEEFEFTVSAAEQHVNAMCKKKLLMRQAGKRRTIQIPLDNSPANTI